MAYVPSVEDYAQPKIDKGRVRITDAYYEVVQFVPQIKDEASGEWIPDPDREAQAPALEAHLEIVRIDDAGKPEGDPETKKYKICSMFQDRDTGEVGMAFVPVDENDNPLVDLEQLAEGEGVGTRSQFIDKTGERSKFKKSYMLLIDSFAKCGHPFPANIKEIVGLEGMTNSISEKMTITDDGTGKPKEITINTLVFEKIDKKAGKKGGAGAAAPATAAPAAAAATAGKGTRGRKPAAAAPAPTPAAEPEAEAGSGDDANGEEQALEILTGLITGLQKEGKTEGAIAGIKARALMAVSGKVAKESQPAIMAFFNKPEWIISQLGDMLGIEVTGEGVKAKFAVPAA